jgi:hypothetical protein
LERKACLEHDVIIHMAEPNDLPAIFQLVDSYCDELDIDRVRAKNSLREIVYLKSVLLVEYKGEYVGGIAGYVLPGLFTKDMFFSTMFFYVKKEFRFLTKQIIKEVELVLLPTPVTKIVYGVPSGSASEKHQRFMRMMGYKELETHLSKDI